MLLIEAHWWVNWGPLGTQVFNPQVKEGQTLCRPSSVLTKIFCFMNTLYADVVYNTCRPVLCCTLLFTTSFLCQSQIRFHTFEHHPKYTHYISGLLELPYEAVPGESCSTWTSRISTCNVTVLIMHLLRLSSAAVTAGGDVSVQSQQMCITVNSISLSLLD